jgi:hypothetical protein
MICIVVFFCCLGCLLPSITMDSWHFTVRCVLIFYFSVIFLFRKLLGHFNVLTVGFLPGFFASCIAILLERPSRRSLLALYVTNVVRCEVIMDC